MVIKEGLVHALTIVAFPLQILSWYYFAGDLLTTLFPIFFSLFAHCLYYVKAIMQGEKIYQKHFFYFQAAVAVVMCVTFFIKLFGYFPEFWIFIVPMFVQVGACLSLYVHMRTAETEDTAQLYNGAMPPNDTEAGTYQNMPREFHAFPPAQKTDYDTL
uniref:Uncharacterized protein n=1 Tax=Pristionchus pacificus TaxID=54126 RepID=A0A4X3NNP6_PRIPA|eukprot:PDM65053.1 hypothetical protein PRIPAC_53302 [Pristionchus pacificus]